MSLDRKPKKPKVCPKIRLGLGLAGLAMSPEEYDAVLRYRYELIGGILVVSS